MGRRQAGKGSSQAARRPDLSAAAASDVSSRSGSSPQSRAACSAAGRHGPGPRGSKVQAGCCYSRTAGRRCWSPIAQSRRAARWSLCARAAAACMLQNRIAWIGCAPLPLWIVGPLSWWTNSLLEPRGDRETSPRACVLPLPSGRGAGQLEPKAASDQLAFFCTYSKSIHILHMLLGRVCRGPPGIPCRSVTA
jgi:hypothetical protein